MECCGGLNMTRVCFGLFLSLNIVFFGCVRAEETKPATPPKPSTTVPTVKTPLDGVWQAKSCQVGGHEQLGSPTEREAIILAVQDGTHKLYFLTDPAKMEGKRIATAKLSVNEKEKTFELVIQDSSASGGTAMHGIYEVSESTLKLCYGPSTADRPTKFDSAKGTLHFCEEWIRYKKK